MGHNGLTKCKISFFVGLMNEKYVSTLDHFLYFSKPIVQCVKKHPIWYPGASLKIKGVDRKCERYKAVIWHKILKNWQIPQVERWLTDRLHDHTPAKLSIFIFIPDCQEKMAMRKHHQSSECSSLEEIDFTQRNVYWTWVLLAAVGNDAVTGSVKFPGSSGNERQVTYFIAYI